MGKTLSAEYYSKNELIWSIQPHGYTFEDNFHIPIELYNCSTLFYVPNLPLSSVQMINKLNQDICFFDRVIHLANANKIINDQVQLKQEEKENFAKTLKLPSDNYCKFIIIDETERIGLTGLDYCVRYMIAGVLPSSLLECLG